MYCVKCGMELNENMQFCPKCGKNISGTEDKKEEKSSKDSEQPVLDSYFGNAGRLIIEKNKASIGMLQREYKIGFNRAARIMDQLCNAGVVGEENGTSPRRVIMSIVEFEDYLRLNNIQYANDVDENIHTVNHNRDIVNKVEMMDEMEESRYENADLFGTLWQVMTGKLKKSNGQVKRWIVGICVLSIMAVIVSTIIGWNQKSSLAKNTFNTDTYEYGGYVTLQKNTVPYSDIEKYLPKDGIYSYLHWMSGDQAEGMPVSEKIFSVSSTEVNYEYFVGETKSKSGSYTIIERVDGIGAYFEVGESVLGPVSSIHMLSPGADFELSDGSLLCTFKNAYTVTVPAGTFQNCICVGTYKIVKDDYEWANGKFFTFDYYAPSVGLVLTIEAGTYAENYFGCFAAVTYELIQIIAPSAFGSNTGIVSPDSTENTVEVFGGLNVIVPDNWKGNYVVAEGNSYYIFCEKTNRESNGDGKLFALWKIHSYEELNYYPERKVLGVYKKENGEWVGLIVSYPTDVTWDTSNEELFRNYKKLSATMDKVIFDSSGIDEFVACDENTLEKYLK